jgi:antitoxin component YwqK of YwqJK toxin-antitoxin module
MTAKSRDTRRTESRSLRGEFRARSAQSDEETFDPQTGSETGEARYANDKLDGVVRHCNADGSLLDEKTYETGIGVATAKAASEAAAAADEKWRLCTVCC